MNEYKVEWAKEAMSKWAVASPGFVARRGKAGDYVMGHSRRASESGAAGCSM